MASPRSPILQRLCSLDRSSDDFHRRLGQTLESQEYKECVETRDVDDLKWVVDLLDEIIDGLSPSTTTSRECLHELSRICGSKSVLPTSYLLPSDSLHVSPEAFASGGYGDVYLATLGGSKVRVKRVRVPHPKYLNAYERAFCEEAVKWKHLKHENILTPIGFTLNPLQIVSEWVPNVTLPEYIRKNPGPRRSITSLLSQTLDGLSHLRSHGVVHGNLRGSSVLVDASGRARITDFGLSTIATRESFTLGPYQPEYSPRWSAPETLEGKAPTALSDIYSFGMLMHEAYSSAVPFSRLTDLEAALAVIDGKRPPRPAHPEVTDQLWNLMQRCWDQNPRLRPDAAEALQILRTSISLAQDNPPDRRLMQSWNQPINPFKNYRLERQSQLEGEDN